MPEIAAAFVSVAPSAVGFKSKLDKQIGSDLDSSGKKAGLGFGKVFAAAGGAIAAAGVGTFLKGAIDQASGLNEAGTKLEAIFGRGSEAVQKFASEGAKALGQSKLEVLDAAANFGTFGKAAGLGGKDLAKFSTGFTTLATDLASFNNTSPEQAVAAIGSALRGEAEPMRQFGVLLDDATLKNEAMKLGLISTTKDALTPAQKVLAAQAAIYKQTKDAQGDFQRTSGGLANQQRILSASFTDLQAKIGTALLPVVTRFASFLNASVMPAVTGFIAGMKSGTGAGGQFAAVLTTTGTALLRVGKFINDNRTAFATLGVAIAAVVALTKVHAAVMAVQSAGGLLAMAKATKVAAAGQWLLNAAMSANPIGLVVVAVAGLVAGMVIAYKKSETFRRIVDNAFAVVKAAASAVASFFTSQVPAAFSKVTAAASSVLSWVKGNWPKILAVLTGPFGVAALLIVKNWDAIKAGGVAALDFIKSIPGKVTAVFAGAATLLYGAGVKLMQGLANGITRKIEDAISAVRNGLSRIKDMLPGSPIKAGPLKPWNSGRPGEMLMEFVARGITKGGAKTREAMKKALDGLKSVLDGLEDQFASLSSSVAGAFNKDVFGGTLEEMFTGLRANSTNLTQMLGAFDTLKKAGASASFLSSLFQSGNGTVALGLAASSTADIKAASALFDDNASLATKLGNKVAGNDLGPKMTEVRDEIRELGKKLDKHLGNAPERTGDAVARGLNRTAATAGRQAYLRGAVL